MCIRLCLCSKFFLYAYMHILRMRIISTYLLSIYNLLVNYSMNKNKKNKDNVTGVNLGHLQIKSRVYISPARL